MAGGTGGEAPVRVASGSSGARRTRNLHTITAKSTSQSDFLTAPRSGSWSRTSRPRSRGISLKHQDASGPLTRGGSVADQPGADRPSSRARARCGMFEAALGGRCRRPLDDRPPHAPAPPLMASDASAQGVSAGNVHRNSRPNFVRPARGEMRVWSVSDRQRTATRPGRLGRARRYRRPGRRLPVDRRPAVRPRGGREPAGALRPVRPSTMRSVSRRLAVG
jgi:hypothetical protein